MRLFSPLLLITTACLGLGGTRACGDGFTLFSGSWGDVIIATDMTPEGRALTPPTREQPVYYAGRSLGCRLGSIPGDREPEENDMIRIVTKVLARQGYLGADPAKREPSLFLFVQWGYLQPGSGDLLWFLGYDARQDVAAPVFPGQLGAEVFRRDFRSRTTQTVLDYADEPIYGIIITAFEYKSASTSKPLIYWQTRIGLPANGKSMLQALPTMIIAAGPSVGRASDTPILRDADDARRGRVDLGDLEVLGYEGDPEPSGRSSESTK